ncbi:hypothetical protein CERSUDRAFT_103441 [Gelatoporia subvermispora B]|uniref:NAD-P-binding protein n=1 Tax=Ceriporiopsis subvermispora (strain B) TaxID=914234 RepID=M2QVH9_CERS8|nr:hypothetical protein CERSUDRAFT_103441 [Gelatoporia subvermispora B]
MGGFFSKGFDPAHDLPDLHGKVIIVTGGNAGIGFAAIQHLARHGAKVYMATRNEEKAKAAIARLQSEGLAPGNGEVKWLYLDLADPKIAKQSAETFMQQEERLDILINNASLFLSIIKRPNMDIVMVNYLSAFVFTQGLVPLLKRTAQEPNSDVRIVTVASQGHNLVPANTHFRSIDDFNHEFKGARLTRFSRYTMTKLMEILYMKELQRRLDAEGVPIIVLSVCPGSVNTDGVQNYAHSFGPFVSRLYAGIANILFATPAKGAHSSVFAAAAPVVRANVREYRGGFIRPPAQLSKTSKMADDPGLAKELWETTEKILNDIGV